MAQNITIMGASYSNVPAVTLPKTGGGTAKFTDVTDTTAIASDLLDSKTMYTADGEKVTGTLVVQHYYTGTTAPTSSLGENGDIYLRTS